MDSILTPNAVVLLLLLQRGPHEAHAGGSGEEMASHVGVGSAPYGTSSDEYVPQRRIAPGRSAFEGLAGGVGGANAVDGLAGGGGGMDRLGFRDGALIAELPSEKNARRMYDHQALRAQHEPDPAERRRRDRGGSAMADDTGLASLPARRHFSKDQQLQGVQNNYHDVPLPQSAPAAQQTSRAAQYQHQQQLQQQQPPPPPSPPVRQHDVHDVPPMRPMPTPPPPQQRQPQQPQQPQQLQQQPQQPQQHQSEGALNFINWYRSKYGAEPPPEMVARASQLPGPGQQVASAPAPAPAPAAVPATLPPRSPIDTKSPRARHRPQPHGQQPHVHFPDSGGGVQGGAQPQQQRHPAAAPAAAMVAPAPAYAARGGDVAPAPAPNASNAAAQKFIDWWVGKYGSEPPAHLVDRAAELPLEGGGGGDGGGGRAGGAQPNDAQQPHQGGGDGGAGGGGDGGAGGGGDGDDKRRGPRSGDFGGGPQSQNVGNSILGRRSTRIHAPPGGQSQISFG